MKNTLGLLLGIAIAGCGPGDTGSDDMGCGTCPVPLIDGVCFTGVSAPPKEATRTGCGDVTEFCDPASKPAPNLTCLATPPAPKSGPATVTLTGFVDVFSNGPDSRGVSVTVFDAATLLAGQDIATASPIATLPNVQLATDTQRACDVDAMEGCTIPLAGGCPSPTCNDGQGGRPDDNKYCKNDGATGTCNQRLRWEARYTIPNIPTNKHLAIRATGPNGMSDQKWANLVAWNVYIPADDRVCKNLEDYDCYNAAKDTYQYNVNALSRSDYVNIPVTAGLSSGISEGRGAAAGEVHDCDNIRVENVAVAVTEVSDVCASPAYDRFAYFNGNPLKTLPDSSRLATDRLGLFAGLNTRPGKVKVVAAGLVGGVLTHMGSFEALVLPNTVSVVNINGGKPRP